MPLLDILAPPCTYRRLVISTGRQWLRGSTSLRRRFDAQNRRLFGRLSGRSFDCNVCGERAGAFFDFPDPELRREHRVGLLRETLQCKRCGATMRHRTLAAALLRVVSDRHGQQLDSVRAAAAAGLAGLRVLDSDAFSPLSRWLRPVKGYLRSSFLPSRPFDAEIEPGHLNLNLERLGLADASFDVVMTSDVAEHIRDIDAAHREIARVLRPGGCYVFTVPFDPACESHHILVDTSGPEDRFLVPPQYHGDPLTGGILAYRVFGRGLLADLARCGLDAEFLVVNDERSLIIEGDAFIARKRPPGAAGLPA